MNDVERFLAHAIALEREAARRYEELSAAMGTEGNRELREFFDRMAHFSRLHLKEAQDRAGFRDLPHLAAHEYEWPDGTAPETADWVGVDAHLDVRGALELALESERRGHAYYAAISAGTQDAELRHIAAEFATEEADHLAALQKLIAALPA